MTHDELLAKIDEKRDYAVERFGLDDGFNALRAVVELHKPEKMIIKGMKAEYWCVADNNEPTPYPCPTILQIEKELQ